MIGVRRLCCAGPADSSGAVCEKTVEIPQLQLVVFVLGQCRQVPVVQSAENCEGPAVAVLLQFGRCPCCAGRVGAAGLSAVLDVL